MSKRKAPYLHADGSNCWTKNCSLGNKLNRPLRIGLDLDNTTGDFTEGLRQYVAKQRNINPSDLPTPQTYDYVEAGWFDTPEEFYKTFQEAETQGLYKTLAPHTDAPKTIRRLVASGEVEIHIVTARKPEWNEHTRQWLKKHRIPYHSLTHTEDKETVKNVDVFIDDSDKQIETLSAHGRTIIAYDNPYNQHIETKYRVRSWSEIEAVITVMKTN